jgi:hypothetical protein
MATPTTVTQSIVVTPGQTVVIPAGATITSLILDGSISVTSSCDNLPTPSAYKCGVFYMNIDDDANDNHPNDEDSTKFTSIKFGDTTVTLDGLLLNQTVTGLNTYLAGQTPIFQFTYINRYTINDPGDDKRDAVFVYFKVAEALYDSLELTVTGNSGMTLPTTQIYRPYAETTCGEYTEY